MKTYGRRETPSSARATTSSEWPSPYTAAVSIQFTPHSSARRIAAMEAASSCGPQANSHWPPPAAQLPKPRTVMSRSELPRRRVFMRAPARKFRA